MANKEIRAVYDNGVMIWPATTTTAVVDPTSREALDVILGKKEDKPIEITDCIPSRFMSLNSSSSADLLTPAEALQLEPLLDGWENGEKFTYLGIDAIKSDDILSPHNTYLWEIIGLRLPLYNAIGLAQTGSKTITTLELHWMTVDLAKKYWVEYQTKDILCDGEETDPTNQPTFIDIKLDDLTEYTGAAGQIWYSLGENDTPIPESFFIDSEGRNKRVVIRLCPLEEDDDLAVYSDYYPVSIELSPSEEVYFDSNVPNATHNDVDEILQGIQVHRGILYCATIAISVDSEDDSIHYYTPRVCKINLSDVISGMPGYDSVPTYPIDGDTYTTGFGKLNRIIQSHEEVTARALLDLNSRIIAQGMKSIMYSELIDKRDNGDLLPGSFYKITDYITTTAQTDTQSAGHVFDVIVLALSESTLSETAWADHREEDTYFSNCKLEAWELKYCLDNDTDRFSWADTTNGKGVIYWMKDEWENECSYDFKNIQFKRQLTNGSLDTTSGTNTWCYTFNYWNSTTSASEDLTMHNMDTFTQYGQADNIIPCWSNKFGRLCNIQSQPFPNFNLSLNDNVFLNTHVSGNICYNNIFGSGCFYNTFGQNCYNNTFGNLCFSNTFGDFCSNNTFGNDCSNNTFGNDCNNNSFSSSNSTIIIPGGHTRRLIVDPDNRFITLTSTLTLLDNDYLQNIHITSGVNTSNTVKTISHNSLNDTFLTTYKPANSVEISV